MKKITMGLQPGSANNKIAVMFGMVGGLYQHFLNIRVPVDFLSKLGEAAITAAVCGLMGVMGKELYKVLRNSIVGIFRNRKNRRSMTDQQRQ